MKTQRRKPRSAGIRWELKALAQLKPLFNDAKTSRNESRVLDAKKIDLTNTDPFAFQCKAGFNQPNFAEVLKEIDSKLIKAVLFKNGNIKGDKGELVVLYLSDFIDIIKSISK